MTWEAALLSAYKGKTSNTVDDLIEFFGESVFTAFKDIESCLSDYIIDSRITPHKNLAKLHIEDKSFGIFVFVVAVDREQNNVHFYSLLNGEKWNTPEFKYTDLKALGKEVVLHEFTKLYLSRDINQKVLYRKSLERKGKLGASLSVSEISVLTRLSKECIEDAFYNEKMRLKRKKEQEELAELAEFRKHICTEFNAKYIKDVVSSVGRINDEKAILRYVGLEKYPESGYAYRASMKHQDTNEVYSIRIYDNKFNLISTCTPELKKQDRIEEPV